MSQIHKAYLLKYSRSYFDVSYYIPISRNVDEYVLVYIKSKLHPHFTIEFSNSGKNAAFICVESALYTLFKTKSTRHVSSLYINTR